MQVPAPAADHEPGAQLTQVAIEVALVAALKVPAAHCVQAPASELDHVPAAHAVHEAEPAFE